MNVVAIDGAAGSGKSTLARGLARRLRLPYINTGLMYRALAASALRLGIAPDDEEGLVELTRGLSFRLTDGKPPELEVEGYDEHDLTAPDVESRVSAVSRHARVRELMRDAQRSLGAHGAVMEGRDIGTVVFPDAPVKLFLDAHPQARVERRAEERGARRDGIAAALRTRDADDARTNPLVPAPDAVVLDTGALDVVQTLEAALAAIRERAPELLPGDQP
jgi:cytidylate kinase